MCILYVTSLFSTHVCVYLETNTFFILFSIELGELFDTEWPQDNYIHTSNFQRIYLTCDNPWNKTVYMYAYVHWTLLKVHESPTTIYKSYNVAVYCYLVLHSLYYREQLHILWHCHNIYWLQSCISVHTFGLINLDTHLIQSCL